PGPSRVRSGVQTACGCRRLTAVAPGVRGPADVTRELRCDFGSEWSVEELRPGTLLIAKHCDGRNRQLHLVPGGKGAGFHVVDSSHRFGFLPTTEVTRVDGDGFVVDKAGTAHWVIGRHE